jgi:hypothetical protein
MIGLIPVVQAGFHMRLAPATGLPDLCKGWLLGYRSGMAERRV